MDTKGVLVFASPVWNSTLTEVILSPSDSLKSQRIAVYFLTELSVEFESLPHSLSPRLCRDAMGR